MNDLISRDRYDILKIIPFLGEGKEVMYSKVISCSLMGLQGVLLQVEVDVRNGLPGISMVGSLSTEVREAKERVLTALYHMGYQLPPKRVTINFSPADFRKEGSAFDLPIAIAILTSYGYFPNQELNTLCFIGEVGLNGDIQPVNGILPMVSFAKSQGLKVCFVPYENRLEGSVIEGIDVIGVRNLKEVVQLLKQPKERIPTIMNGRELLRKNTKNENDFEEVIGQEFAKRAAEIAAAGRHNLLLLGAPGTGKSMIASRIPTIMPALTMEESLEITKIYSIKGKLDHKNPLITARPFRSPHHTITETALIGGGRVPSPGEISLAHYGVLFLDELPEFQRNVLEVLRQPLEEREISITRMQGSFAYPADILFLGAMNPCPCGYYPNQEKCHCTPLQIRRYLGKISHPLLERIDLMAEVHALSYEELQTKKKGESSAVIRKRVAQAVEIQKERYEGVSVDFNGQLNQKQLEKFCIMEENAKRCLKDVFWKKKWSARTYYRILKVARTIADLEASTHIQERHMIEAIAYRGMEQKYWG